MKKLKILIITEGDNLSSVAAMTAFKIVSSLKLGANFYYAKSFDEALQDCYEEKIKSGYYDVICLLTNDTSIKMYSVIDNIKPINKKNAFIFLSTSDYLIERSKIIDDINFSFRLNEKQELVSEDFEKIRLYLSDLIFNKQVV